MKGEKDTALTDRQAYEWASVSTTQISNNTSDCGYHTPLTPRSATRPGIPLVSSASLTTGSVPPLCMLVLQYLPGHPSVHCVSVLLICAFLTIEGMLQAELSAQPSQLQGILRRSRQYLIASAFRNTTADRSNWWRAMGSMLSQSDVFPSTAFLTTRLLLVSICSRVASSFLWSCPISHLVFPHFCLGLYNHCSVFQHRECLFALDGAH